MHDCLSVSLLLCASACLSGGLSACMYMRMCACIMHHGILVCPRVVHMRDVRSLATDEFSLQDATMTMQRRLTLSHW